MITQLKDGFGAVAKMNIEMASLLVEAVVDSNTFHSLSLSKLCPAEKRVSVTVMYSAFETAQDIVRVLNLSGDHCIYITGNSAKTLAPFGISEADVANWLTDVLRKVRESIPALSIVTDAMDGVGIAAAAAAARLGLECAGVSPSSATDIEEAIKALNS